MSVLSSATALVVTNGVRRAVSIINVTKVKGLVIVFE